MPFLCFLFPSANPQVPAGSPAVFCLSIHMHMSMPYSLLGWWIVFNASLSLYSNLFFSHSPLPQKECLPIKLLPKVKLFCPSYPVLNVLLTWACFSKPVSFVGLSLGVWILRLQGTNWHRKKGVVHSKSQNALLPRETLTNSSACWKNHWAHHQPWALSEVHMVSFYGLCGKVWYGQSQVLFCSAFFNYFLPV